MSEFLKHVRLKRYASYARTAACLLRGDGKREWQIWLAATCTLYTAIILSLMSVGLIGAAVTTGNPLPARMLPFFASGTLASAGLYALHRAGELRFTGLYLVCVYLAMACGLTGSVGIGVGAGIMLLFAAAIITAGILCGYRCALVPAMFSTLFLLAYRAAELRGVVHPAYLTTPKPTNFDTVLFVALLFQLLAVVGGYLYRAEQPRRQRRATQAEHARQLHRLSEAGAMSTVFMHSLANRLTALALDIDSMETAENQASVQRAKSQLRYINETLSRTRQRLKGESRLEVFDLAQEVSRTVEFLRPVARRAQVVLEWHQPSGQRRYACLGEQALFQQLLANVIHNAIESYEAVPSTRPQRTVLIALTAKDDTSLLLITDWGAGIAPEAASKVFEPFYTTKKNGIGMGMYLTRHFIEGSFGGQVELRGGKKQTVLVIRLPQQHIGSMPAL